MGDSFFFGFRAFWLEVMRPRVLGVRGMGLGFGRWGCGLRPDVQCAENAPTCSDADTGPDLSKSCSSTDEMNPKRL